MSLRVATARSAGDGTRLPRRPGQRQHRAPGLDVDVSDKEFGYWPACDSCDAEVAGCVVSIRDDRITAARVLPVGHIQGRPQQDSNLRTRLRRPMLYPLSYGGWTAAAPTMGVGPAASEAV